MSDKKQQKKVASKKGLRNPDRKNGKAFKKVTAKHIPAPRTPEAVLANFRVLQRREATKASNLRKADVGNPKQPKKVKQILAADVTGMKHLEKTIERIVFGSRPAYAH